MIPKNKQKVNKSGDTMTGPLEFNNKSVFQAIKKVRTINEEDYTLSLGVGADKSAAIEIAKNGVILGRIDIMADGTIKNFKTNQRLIEEGEIYYKSGDTIQYKEAGELIVSGTLTGSGKKILFSFNTYKRLDNITNITIQSLPLGIRHPTGGYIKYLAFNFVNYIEKIYKINENTIGIALYNDDGWDYTNNVPLVITNEKELVFNLT